MTDELKPCPFCGGKAEYAHNPFHGDKSMARCVTCGASAFWSKWNQRAAGASEGQAATFDATLEATAYGGIPHNDARIRCARAVYDHLMRTQSAEIAALRERIAGMEKACKPFVEAFELVHARSYDGASEAFTAFLDGNTVTPAMTTGDFRRLRDAVEKQP